MKLAALAFLLLLAYTHESAGFDRSLAQPLSTFRDGEQAWLGYALFTALLGVGVLYAAALVRSERPGEAVLAALAVLFLAVVAATPSLDGFHTVCSLLLLLLLFGYYALLLRRAGSFLLFAHLAVPAALVLVIRFHSYGLWQKGLVAYFVAAVVIHHHLLCRQPSHGVPRARRPCGAGGNGASKRRTVYRVETGRAWKASRPPARSLSTGS